MFTQEQAQAPVSGLTAQDCAVGLQIIRRLVKSGQLEDVELATVSLFRIKLANAIREATGIDYDNPQPVQPVKTEGPAQPAKTEGAA